MTSSTRAAAAACTECGGSGAVPDRAVSAAMRAVTGVRGTVRRPCPGCYGAATDVSPAVGGRSSNPAR
jgi:hypothetical protein